VELFIGVSWGVDVVRYVPESLVIIHIKTSAIIWRRKRYLGSSQKISCVHLVIVRRWTRGNIARGRIIIR